MALHCTMCMTAELFVRLYELYNFAAGAARIQSLSALDRSFCRVTFSTLAGFFIVYVYSRKKGYMRYYVVEIDLRSQWILYDFIHMYCRLLL